MKLNKANLMQVKGDLLPPANVFNLPEKVLQFGTGVLLRGLPDYFIDKANRAGVFNGRIAVVKSTKGSSSDFDDQDSLYTIGVRGVENNRKIEKNIICSSISRVLSASDEWEEILNIAASPALEIIISNTTEVGIALVADDNILAYPPVSFPGKLLSVLYHRFKMFNGATNRGLIVVPTELIPDNADKLKGILLTLAKNNGLHLPFINWLQNSNYFCNSLVDRIVPGKPDEDVRKALATELGYQDDLVLFSEAYSLWAIQGDEKIKEKLTFAQVNEGVVITPDIDLHRELKLRLLNGAHTLSCGVAVLAGFETVKDGMDNPDLESFISDLMKLEISPAIPYSIPKATADDFSDKVLDRFRNPYIKHQWISISMNYTSKLKMRVVPVLLNYAKLFNKAPQLISFGFAAYIFFMKAKIENGKHYGSSGHNKYLINDDKAAYLTALWEKNGETGIVNAVLGDDVLWGTDLTQLPDFKEAVAVNLKNIIASSTKSVLNGIIGLSKTEI